ncbi:50S ribosomal protein L23 [Candidatus Alkanophaga liquidiphilum]|nr:Ribosomal protein L23 [Candidatus Alkanophaga liquidiphilum]RLG38516.1 MAG: 50S ribosomal protein L23 [Candidatus Alkanophagales archaeon]
MVIKHLVASEKAATMIEAENKLQFIVDINANKTQIKEEVEQRFGARVRNVRTMVTPKGEKKAIVQFEEEGKAREIATTLGILS